MTGLNLALMLQYVGILLLFIELGFLYSRKPSRLQSILLGVFMATIVNFVGYLFEIKAMEPAKALLAVKIIYLGKPFILFGIFIFVLEYCKVKLSNILVKFLFAYSAFVSMLVMTCEHHTLFYKSMNFTYSGHFPHLVFKYGFFYKLHMCLIVIFLIMMIYILVQQFRKATNWTERYQVLSLMAINMISFGSLVVYMSGVTNGYDCTVPAYLISTWLLLFAITKFDLLDVLVLAKDNIIDNFPEGLVVLNSSGKLVYSNTAAQNIYPSLSDENNYAMALEDVREHYLKQMSLKANDRIYEVGEQEIWKQGNFYGRIYIVRDNTEYHNFTVNLQRQKMIAEQANCAKSDFLARMSHEIRTPINSVLGMNEMILREPASKEIKQYSMDIKNSASALLSIINDILDSSKIESGKMEILPVEYEVSSLLNDTIQMNYVKMKDKGLKLDVIADENIPSRLWGDDVRIRQILLNIFSNAVKYTTQGTITFTVRETKREDDIVSLLFEIKDTGMGIRKEDIPRLFSSYERIDEQRNRYIEGTGLGLSIVTNLLKLMGSELKVESEYGVGSTFYFILEQKIMKSKPMGNFAEKIGGMSQEKRYRALFTAPGASVLVVDDNDINRKVFRNLLKQTKVKVTEAYSGQMCLNLVKENVFDLIFLDHMMPEMDGVETLHRMQMMPDQCCKGVPVIMLTANAITGAREQYLRQGFDDFLAKPIVPEKLEKMMKHWLPKELILEEDMLNELLEPDVRDIVSYHTSTQPVYTQPQPEPQPEGTALLPPVEGIDWNYALTNLPDEELIFEVVTMFYDSLDHDREIMDHLAAKVPEDESIAEYRVKVHALKSTAATIGALGLSEMAKGLEFAAKSGDYPKIQKEHPILSYTLDEYKKRLAKVVERG